MPTMDKIQPILEAEGLSINEFCRKLDIVPSRVSKGIQRKTPIKGDLMALIVKKFNINPYWLLFGDGHMYLEKRPWELLERITYLENQVEFYKKPDTEFNQEDMDTVGFSRLDVKTLERAFLNMLKNNKEVEDGLVKSIETEKIKILQQQIDQLKAQLNKKDNA